MSAPKKWTRILTANLEYKISVHWAFGRMEAAEAMSDLLDDSDYKNNPRIIKCAIDIRTSMREWGDDTSNLDVRHPIPGLSPS